MRVLIVVYVFPPEIAPAGVMCDQLASYLEAAGHEVVVVTGWPNHPTGKLFASFRRRWRSVEDRDGVRVVRVWHTLGKNNPVRRILHYFTFAVNSFAAGLRVGPVDSVVCLSTPLFGVWSALAIARCRHARFVNVLFDLWPDSILNAGLVSRSVLYRVAHRIDSLSSRLSDRVVTIAPGLEAGLLARGVSRDRLSVIPLWIDVDAVHPLPLDNSWRTEHDIPSDRFVALFAGTIGYASGAEILADVAQRLASDPRIELLVVGEGVSRSRLESRAAERRVVNMRFLDFQPQERLAEMQSAANVGIVTLRPNSGLSSVPSKVLGYMAAGRPVVASVAAESDTAALIRSANCGIVVAPGDDKAIADALTSLASDSRQASRLGENGRRHVVRHYSSSRGLRDYEALLVERN